MLFASMERVTVLVTGFGPFGCYTVNASWEAVKILPHLLNTEELGINLVIAEIPVDYEETMKSLCKLWEEHKPVLIINVGVSHQAKQLTLESCASKNGYEKADIHGKVPPHKECCIGTETQLFTKLDVEKLAKDVNSLMIGVDCCTSKDAGRYLCEFSYCTSLSLNGQNSLFVHVPDIGKPYMPEETAKGLCEVIRLAVAQVKMNDRVCLEVVNNNIL